MFLSHPSRFFFALFLAIVIGSSLLSPKVHAQTQNRTELLAQIQQLMQLITKLQQQLAERGGQSMASPVAGCLQLTQSLYVGSRDATSNGEVSKLQQFLTGTGDYTYGEVTGYYGPATLTAVQRWQQKHGVVTGGSPESTGYGLIGPKTRAAIAQACTSSAAATTPAADTPKSTTPTTPVPFTSPTATIKTLSDSSRPRITGTANVDEIDLKITKSGSVSYQAKNISVSNGAWSHTVTTNLAVSLYSVTVSVDGVALDQEALEITESDTTSDSEGTTSGVTAADADAALAEAEAAIEDATNALDAVLVGADTDEAEQRLNEALSFLFMAQAANDSDDYEAVVDYANDATDKATEAEAVADAASAAVSVSNQTYAVLGNEVDGLIANNGYLLKTGTAGAETLTGTNGNDVLNGLGGADTLNGGVGNDILVGADGGDSDVLNGGSDGAIASYYTAQSALVVDFVAPGNNQGAEVLADTWISITGIIGAHNFKNTFVGDSADNVFVGGNKDDSFSGGPGNDALSGFDGNDKLFGGDGDDVLIGRKGDDTMTGNAGKDGFMYYDPSGNGNDVVTDFEVGDDLVMFYKTGLSYDDLSFSNSADGAVVMYNDSSIRFDGRSVVEMESSANFMFY